MRSEGGHDASTERLRRIPLHRRAEWSTPTFVTGSTPSERLAAVRSAAARAGAPLYRVDLHHFVSKYIGETEKNLATVFEAAERNGAVLLFDEADALFGERSGVTADRYANLEVSYLLKAIAAHPGLVIISVGRPDELPEGVDVLDVGRK